MPTDTDAGAVGGEYAGEDLVPIAEVFVHGVRKVVACVATEAAGRSGEAAGPVEADQLFWLLDGQHAEKNLIEDGEDRGVGTDAEGEGENDGECEARRLAQLAKCKAKILKERIHT